MKFNTRTLTVPSCQAGRHTNTHNRREDPSSFVQSQNMLARRTKTNSSKCCFIKVSHTKTFRIEIVKEIIICSCKSLSEFPVSSPKKIKLKAISGKKELSFVHFNNKRTKIFEHTISVIILFLFRCEQESNQ